MPRVVDGPAVIAVIDIRVQQHEVEPRIRRELDAPLEAPRQLIAIIGVLAIEEGVVPEAITLEILHRQAPRRMQAFDRPGGDDTHGPRVVVGAGRVDRESRRHRRIGAAHRNHACERIGTEARALRTSQYFDLRHIEQRRGHADATEIHVIDEESDRRIGCALVLLELADAANLEEARPRGATGPVEVRHLRQHILEMLLAATDERVLVQYRDTCGYLLQGLVAQQSCAHDHFLNRALRLRGRRRPRNRRGAHADKACARRKYLKETHVRSPGEKHFRSGKSCAGRERGGDLSVRRY